MSPIRLFVVACLVAAPSLAAAQAPVAGSHPFATDAQCDPELGVVSLRMDVLGAFGSSSNGANATFDPVDDPDLGAQGTVYESMPFLCRTADGASSGRWLDVQTDGDPGAQALGEPNRMVSTYTVDGVTVDMVADLDCTTLTQCYTLTNGTGGPLDELALIHYVDGDLNFVGSFSNDFGATSAGDRRVVFEFDEGDDPDEPTTQLALYGTDPRDRFVTGWEIGEYDESQTRIGSTADGCEPLRNGLRDEADVDVDADGDLVTDNGFDVTLSLRLDAGPLAPGEMSPPICFSIRWGYALACSDEDEDGVCVPLDNCPDVPNPDQLDSDGDGVGDACQCDPSPEQCDGADDDCDGVIDEDVPVGAACQTGAQGACAAGATACVAGAIVCEPAAAPTPEQCNGIDDDCDGIVDDGNPGGGGACQTGQPGICAAGVRRCQGGALACVASNPPGVEQCNGLDDDCDGAVDDGDPGGGADCQTGLLGACQPGRTACVGGAVSCRPLAQPVAEQCNGVDDDCDGVIDDGNPGGGAACQTGLPGICQAGRMTCAGGAVSCQPLAQPAAEQCNGIDDDCDGAVDEGNPGGGGACQTGQPGVCAAGVMACAAGRVACQPLVAPSPEQCNGLDDDCDGAVDDDTPGAGAPCETGGQGACSAGVSACRGGVEVCDPRAPGAEQCNGVDDDCDGAIDEGDPGGGAACPTGEPGVCAAGRSTCIDGALACEAASDPAPERCNRLDDDCDGMTDEGAPEAGAACQTGGRGVCAAGLTRCGPQGIQCVQSAQPSPERCNGLDDDCDGSSDEGSPGAGGVCQTGQPGACAAGRSACQGGGVVCVPDAAPMDEICDGVDNDCDGMTDEGDPGGGDACQTGRPGICAGGTTACRQGAVACVGARQARAELCDGADDDCDGRTDEGDPGAGAACQTGGQGVCAAGVSACRAGAVVCDGLAEASAELCNGLDDDCDGMADEGAPGAGEVCQTGGQGVCATGVTACVDGGLACQPDDMPSDDICNGLDDDCDGRIDERDPGGGEVCQTGGQGACATGVTACDAGAVVCVPDAAAMPETCNGRDDDCDGASDEGRPGADVACQTGRPGLCAAGTTACRAGAIACDADVAAVLEVCNGLDDDCDGQVDEGQPGGGAACDTGVPGVCARGRTACRDGAIACDQVARASDETCDGADQDCDGMADEGEPGAGEMCRTGEPGVCAAGRTICDGGAIACDAIGQPGAEVCDAVDNDCDGRVDEGTQGGDACQTGQPGVCAEGTTACVGDALECLPDIAPSDELCDGLDNDCDGMVDEGAAGVGAVCATGQPGLCARGRTVCVAGALGCQPDVQPREEVCNGRDENCDGRVDEDLRNGCGLCGPDLAEVCDGVDDDCDGIADEQAPCAVGVCRFGRCVDPCQNNECAQSGLLCVEGLCVSPCELLDCPAGTVCDGQQCVDVCQGVECAESERCVDGMCEADDCAAFGCPDGQRCAGAMCEGDPCFDVDCAAGSFCREGVCVPSCAAVSCPLGEVCVDGMCLGDDCAAVECEAGEVCIDGACAADLCDGVQCPPGTRCDDGMCDGDPCAHVACPAGQRCTVVAGTGQCVWPEGDPIDPMQPDGGAPEPDAAVSAPDLGLDAAADPGPGVELDGGVIPSNPDGGADGIDDPGASGCECDADGGPGPAGLLWLALLLGLRRRR